MPGAPVFPNRETGAFCATVVCMKTCRDCGKSKGLDEFYAKQSYCKPCSGLRTKAWRAANPDRHKANKKRQRKREAPNPEATRRKNLRSKYGISPEQYDALLAEQGGGCACCGKTSAGGRHGRFHVDHDHKTGKIRGLLCHSCNVGIGALGDTIVGIERAARYLRRPARIPK